MVKFIEKQHKIVEEAARNHIFEAVIRVTQQAGVTDFTMQQVADEAGMAMGSLYKYFKNKDDLLAYVFTHLVDMHRTRQNAIAQGPGGVCERLEQMATASFQFSSDHLIFFRIFSCSGLHSQLSEEVKQHKINEDVGVIKELMSEGIALGLLREQDPLLMARMFFSCTIGFFSAKHIFYDYGPGQVAQGLIGLFKA